MKLFHEAESKYYELLSYLVNARKTFTSQELNKWVLEYCEGETDYEVWDVLFSKKDGEEVLFKYENDAYRTMIGGEVPIRSTWVEKQAAKNLIENKYAECFLQEDTIHKIKDKLKKVDTVWDESAINVKRRNLSDKVYDRRIYMVIKTIMNAIYTEKAIIYSNTLQDGTVFRDVSVFPVKIEYSLQNDMFRVSAYEPVEERFIRMDLSTMEDVSILDKTMSGLTQKYNDFIQNNMKTVVLDVEPVSYIVERCFRLFSYYDRKARFNVDDNKYQLEIKYLKFDEGEIIRNILSFGENVVVTSPEDMRRLVYQRIRKACEVYK